MIKGVKASPNSRLSRSASVFRRTVPNTLKPLDRRTLQVPNPIPVDTPVTTTVCSPLISAPSSLVDGRYVTVRNQGRSIPDGHPDGVQAANGTCGLIP